MHSVLMVSSLGTAFKGGMGSASSALKDTQLCAQIWDVVLMDGIIVARAIVTTKAARSLAQRMQLQTQHQKHVRGKHQMHTRWQHVMMEPSLGAVSRMAMGSVSSAQRNGRTCVQTRGVEEDQTIAATRIVIAGEVSDPAQQDRFQCLLQMFVSGKNPRTTCSRNVKMEVFLGVVSRVGMGSEFNAP